MVWHRLGKAASARTCGFDSLTLRQLGNEVIGSPATRARHPFFGEISSRFEFSKARSGLFEFLLLKFQIDDLMK